MATIGVNSDSLKQGGVVMANSKIRILAIDGGGVRGVIPARILIRVEELLQEISRNPRAKINDFFDLVAETSTGGIITALILAPDPGFRAPEFVELYAQHGEVIFTRSAVTKTIDPMGLFNPLYQHDPLEKILVKYFGGLKVSDLVKPCLIPTYNIENGSAIFVSGLEIREFPSQDCFIKDVIRATTAAPTYFAPSKRLKDAFIDGGMFANNPALCAYIEATKFPIKPRPEDIMILSLGTGSINRKYPYEKAHRWGRLNWLRPALEIYAAAASQTVNHQLEILYDQKEKQANYLRIEPNLQEFKVNVAMDDTSPANIQALIKVGEQLSEQYESKLRNFLTKVVLSNVVSNHEILNMLPSV